MNSFTLDKGLDLPLAGAPCMEVEDASEVGRVALVGPDYPGMRPTMEVSEGERVRLGQVLFSDKKNPRVVYTSPGSGRIRAINRGKKRVFLSIEIELDGNDEESFAFYPESHLANLDRNIVVETLLASGLWTALRRRPFGHIPDPGEVPRAVFITAIDTHPLAPDPCVVIAERVGDFSNGVKILSTLTDGPLYLCTRCKAAGLLRGAARHLRRPSSVRTARHPHSLSLSGRTAACGMASGLPGRVRRRPSVYSGANFDGTHPVPGRSRD